MRKLNSNFEFTWSLIEHLNATCDLTEVLTTLSADFEHTWSLITACCEQTQSNFEHTWSLINNVETTLTQCCAQTTSNFEFTWSLIEHLNATCDLTEVLTTLSACCEETTSNFEFTWCLLAACCNETQSLIQECCAQTNSNFLHTFSLIESISAGGCPCAPIPLTQADVVGTITLATAGVVYCMAENITGNIVINAPQVTVLMNVRQLTGLITINAIDVNVENGFILALAPTDTTDAAQAAVTVGAQENVSLINLVITCQNTTAVSGLNGVNGRTGIANSGYTNTHYSVLYIRRCRCKWSK